jgi:hypothetical protein
MYGLSHLEIKRLLQRALLPDTCRCDIASDGTMSLVLSNVRDAKNYVVVSPIRLDSLNSSRAIANLVGEARYLLATKGIHGAEVNVRRRH